MENPVHTFRDKFLIFFGLKKESLIYNYYYDNLD